MRPVGDCTEWWTIGIRTYPAQISPHQRNIVCRAVVSGNRLPCVPMSSQLLFKNLSGEGYVDAGIQDLDRSKAMLPREPCDIAAIHLRQAGIEMRQLLRQRGLSVAQVGKHGFGLRQ